MAQRALVSARERLLGRDTELERVTEALTDPDPRPRFLVLTGGPGVGKSSLALLAHLQAVVLRRRSVFFTASLFSPTPASITDALEELGLERGFSDLGFGTERELLVLDGFEHLWPVAPWLFTQLLAQAGANLTVLITSRRSLAPVLGPYEAFTTVHEVPLHPLGDQEATRLLEKLGVPDARVAELVERARGLPLALTLLARHPPEASKERLPTVLSADLAARVFADASTPLQRRALAALMVVRVCDQPMLQALAAEESSTLYRWLRSLPYVQETMNGLCPHDLLRECVFTDMQANEEALVLELGQSAAREVSSRMMGLTPTEQRPLFLDALYALRAFPVVAGGMNVDVLGPGWLDPVSDADDLAWGIEQIRKAEGSLAAETFYRYQEHCEAPYMMRSGERHQDGLLFSIAHTAPILEGIDPVTRRSLELARELAKQSGTPTLVCRWFFAADTYQEFSPSMTRIMSCGPLGLGARHPQFTLGVTVTIEAEQWSEMQKVSPLDRIERMEYNGAVYGLERLDIAGGGPRDDPRMLQSMSQIAWIAQLAHLDPVELFQAATPAPTPSWGDAEVREALAVLHEPHRLEKSVLAQVFQQDAGGLREQFRNAIEEMSRSHAHAELASVLDVTYFQGASKQRAAAADPRLPWGTYRHRLRRAQEVLAAELGRAPRQAARTGLV